MTLKTIQVVILAGVFLLQYLFEHILPQKKEINDWKNERFNVLIGLLNIVLALVPAALLVKLLDWIGYRQLGLFPWIGLATWMTVPLTIVVMDLWMYVWHRLNHVVPFFWRFHTFHHQDKLMNSTTALRFHFMELLLSYPGKALVCLVFGITYVPLLVYELLFFVSIVVHHSNIRITERTDLLYRKLFVSPMMHRIHHSVKKEERNTNYGALFSFWDRLFGTRRQRADGEIEFGIADTKPLSLLK